MIGNRCGRRFALVLMSIAPWLATTVAAADRPEQAASLLGAGDGRLRRADQARRADRPPDQRRCRRGSCGRSPATARRSRARSSANSRQVATFLADQLDTTWEEGLRTLTGGGVVVGLEEADPPRLVIVVTPEDPAFLEKAHALLVDLARQDASAKGKPDPIKEGEYRGVTAYSVSDQEAHAILDGRLVIASGGEALKAVIDRTSTDGEPDLTKTDHLRRAPARRTTPLAWAYARLDRLRETGPEALRRRRRSPTPAPILLLGGLARVGPSNAPWAAATIDWSDDRLAGRPDRRRARPTGSAEARWPASSRPKGRGPRGRSTVEGRLATINLWRDQAALWEVREDLLPPEALQGLAQLDTFAGQFFGGRDFGDSVLAPLGDHWQLVAAMQDYDGDGPGARA